MQSKYLLKEKYFIKCWSKNIKLQFSPAKKQMFIKQHYTNRPNPDFRIPWKNNTEEEGDKATRYSY